MSLLKHVSDLDRFENIQKASVARYAAAIECIAQYAVEVDPSITGKFQECLRALRGRVINAQTPEVLLQTESALQSEIRDYHDKCEIHLTALRHQFKVALVSLQEVMSSFCSSGKDQEKHLKEELSSLETLALAEDPDVLRRGIKAAVITIAACVEQMRKENDLVVAQFRDEMRTMQHRMEAAEISAALDTGTGALKRSQFENRVRRVVHQEERVCLVILKIGNFRDIRSRHGQHLAAESLAELFRRLREEFGEKADIGRWSDDTFMAVLLSPKQDALKRTREMGYRMAGPYVCVEDGHHHSLHLKINIGIADLHSSEDSDHFLAKAESLQQSMS